MFKKTPIILLLLLVLALTACDPVLAPSTDAPPTDAPPPTANTTPTAEIVGETARVVRVIDGDTIDVDMDGQRYRVRYIGINTPERDEACYQDATDANANWVEGQTVTMVKDVSETDPYDRLLRYIYVGDTFVNAALVQDGYAEAVEYPPDTANADLFNRLEREARDAGRGCHATTTNATPTAEIEGERARVVRIIDGDTIDVDMDGQRYRVRYIGINTPERDEACYQDATDANADWVEGQTITMVKDVSETDPYDRLLRYIYVGGTFVNEALVRDGYAEAVQYPPDTSNADRFNQLEREARSAERGCHPTGVFD